LLIYEIEIGSPVFPPEGNSFRRMTARITKRMVVGGHIGMEVVFQFALYGNSIPKER